MAADEQQRDAAAEAAPPPPPPSIPLPKKSYDLNAKYDACLDLTIRRLAYSSLAGAFTGLLLFRSPTTRWASVAFGAGIGIGAAYTECSYIFDGSPPKWPSPKVPAVQTVHQEEQK